MSEILFQYEKVYPTTWAYLSSLLMIGLFFKFNRFWSMRNADLVLLILLAPGLLTAFIARHELVARAVADLQQVEQAEAAQLQGVSLQDDAAAGVPRQDRVTQARATPGGASSDNAQNGPAQNGPAQNPGGPPALLDDVALAPTGGGGVAADRSISPELAESRKRLATAESIEWVGYVWLLGVGLLLLVRLLIDPTMVRRPLLEPNLTTGGLTFIGCSLFVFLMANIITSRPSEEDLDGARQANKLLSKSDGEAEDAGAASNADDADEYTRHGPGYALMYALPSLTTTPLRKSAGDKEVALVATAKMMAIVSHLAIVLGMVVIGYRHFGSLKTGIGAATLYLMLPYTAVMTGRPDHAAPAALLTWAVVCYRRPLTAGVLLGLGAGMIYYPLFVLPLWISFYWQRGLMRFVSGLFCALAAMVIGLAIAPGGGPFFEQLFRMFGVWPPRMSGLAGVWADGFWDPIYRIPVIVAFLAMAVTFALWPAQKNLGTLLSCTAATMVAAQCWHGFGGGLCMAWYLPLLLLTVFRPNLEDRIASAVLTEGWFASRRRPQIHRPTIAA